MIDRYVNGDPFNATERYLLVPVPTIPSNTSGEGFFGAVLERFPIAIRELAGREFDLGDVLVIGNDGPWVPMYALAFAAIHRYGAEGWRDAPTALGTALNKLPVRVGGITLATAGIPGTGFSGLKGGADPTAIEQVLQDYPRKVTVYTRNESGDREPRVVNAPLDKLSVSL